MAKYTDDQRERACRALVLHDGNTKATEAYLRLHGMDVSDRSLRDWKNSERYAELHGDREWIFEAMAEDAESTALLAGEVERKYLTYLNGLPTEALSKLSPNVIAMAMRSVSVTKGVNTDKAQDLRGRPTRPSGDQRSLAELISGLASKFPEVLPGLKDSPLVIDSTAKEIPDGS